MFRHTRRSAHRPHIGAVPPREWSVERLHLLAQSDSLVAELKKLHVASKVARHIAAKIGNLSVADILSMEAPNPALM